MDQLYFSLAVGLSLAIGAFAGVWLVAPVREYWSQRRREREIADMFDATNRQRSVERLNARRELYLSFRNAAAGLVEELADGGGRWASFYLARDLLRDVNTRGAPEAALAARQMCFVCQVMLNNGFSDELSVKFDQSLRRYEAACREDLQTAGESPIWPMEGANLPDAGVETSDFAEAPPEEDAPRRRYFHVLR